MIISEFRAEARKRLSGKWGKAICFILAYGLFLFVLGFIEGLFPESVSGIVSLATTIINIPLTFGIIITFMKLYNGEDFKAFDFISLGFSNFAKSWKISLQILVKMIVPIILLIVSFSIFSFGIIATTSAALVSLPSVTEFSGLTIVGLILSIVSMIWVITKSYYYKIAYFIAVDNEDMSAKSVVEKSKELMTGKRGKLFLLELSFIGWAILASLTLGIGYLWLIPYIQLSTIAFYKFVSGNNSNVEAEVITENATDDNDPIK